MGADDTDTASSTDHSVVDDGHELHKRKRAFTRKVDLRILPLLSINYLISYLIRSNISNAKLAGYEFSMKHAIPTNPLLPCVQSEQRRDKLFI